ncbi:CaiB/BaiF CoA transferase family protein, partial [Chloroflexota bacterium]
SYQPGYLGELGLNYNKLNEINPRLIMASITAFGQSGPYKNHKADDMVISAMGGQIYASGEPESPPLKPYGHQTYYSGGLFAAIGISLAIWARHTTKKGQYIDISLEECAAATLDHVLVRYLYQGEIAKRQGSLHWNKTFRIFPCKDGYILLSLFQQWPTLVEWLDSEGMAQDLTDKKWLDKDKRIEQIDHIIEVLEQWTRSHTTSELVEKGQLMRFPWAKITSIPELMNNPQLKERNFFINVEQMETGKTFKLPGLPYQLNNSPRNKSKHIPSTGEHNMKIYHEELGLSKQEIETLIKQGII